MARASRTTTIVPLLLLSGALPVATVSQSTSKSIRLGHENQSAKPAEIRQFPSGGDCTSRTA